MTFLLFDIFEIQTRICCYYVEYKYMIKGFFLFNGHFQEN